MREMPGLGLGGFLLGLGLGWYIFKTLEISGNVFAWLLVLAGATVIVSTLISWKSPGLNIGGIVGGLMGGLILSLLLTSGFGIIGDITRGGTSVTYRARDTKSYSGIVTAGKVYMEVDNFNGPVTVSTWEKAEYSVDLTIRAKREKHLDDLKIDFDEGENQELKRLTLKYDIPPTDKSKYAIEVDVTLPADALIDLNLASSNGGIYLTDIKGDNLNMATSNGPLVFEDVYGDSVRAGTSNGGIEGLLESKNAVLSTSNGKIDLTIPCTVSGEYDLGTSNSDVELKVSKSAQVGYDLDLTTSNGNININLPDLEYRINQKTSKEARTEGFSGLEIQITIETNTSNGSIEVHT